MEQFSDYNWRGPRIADFNVLKAQGFQRLISLETPLDYIISPSNEVSPQDNLDFHSIPCSEVMPPNPWQVAKVQELLKQPIKTYLHCYSGVDRTGYMVAVYRMAVDGWTYDKALQEWVDKGRHYWYAWWKYALKCYAVNG